MEQKYRNVAMDVVATIRVEMQVPANTPEDAEQFVQDLAENKCTDLIDGKIKDLEPTIWSNT